MATSFLLPPLHSMTNLNKQRSTKHSLARRMIVAKFRDPNLPSILPHKVSKIHLTLLSDDGSKELHYYYNLTPWWKHRKNTKVPVPKAVSGVLRLGYSHGEKILHKSLERNMENWWLFWMFAKGCAKERSDGVDRRDMIFDVYSEDSIKSAEREWSGSQKLG